MVTLIRAGFGLAIALTVLAAAPLRAEPRIYDLDVDRSNITFFFEAQGKTTTGTVPFVAADIVLDFDNLANSDIEVLMSMAGLRTGVFFYTEAIKSKSVFYTRTFPRSFFVSRNIKAVSGGARLQGDLTMRGVTRPMTLDVAIYRQRGTDEGDRDHMALVLTGAFNRSDFGATGYEGVASDRVQVRIIAEINRRPLSGS